MASNGRRKQPMYGICRLNEVMVSRHGTIKTVEGIKSIRGCGVREGKPT
jgi:hypothetical protein